MSLPTNSMDVMVAVADEQGSEMTIAAVADAVAVEQVAVEVGAVAAELPQAEMVAVEQVAVEVGAVATEASQSEAVAMDQAVEAAETEVAVTPSVDDLFAALEAQLVGVTAVTAAAGCTEERLVPFEAPDESSDEQLAKRLTLVKARAALVEWRDMRAAVMDQVAAAIAARDAFSGEIAAHRAQGQAVLQENQKVIATLQARYEQALANIDQDAVREVDLSKIDAKWQNLYQAVRTAAAGTEAQRAIVVHFHDAIGALRSQWTERRGTGRQAIEGAFAQAELAQQAARTAGFPPASAQIIRELAALLEAARASFEAQPAIIAAATIAKANLDEAQTHQQRLQTKIAAISASDATRLAELADAIEPARSAAEAQLAEVDSDPALIGLDAIVSAAKELEHVEHVEPLEAVAGTLKPYKGIFALDLAAARKRVDAAEAQHARQEAEARKVAAQKNRDQESRRRVAELRLQSLIKDGALTVGGDLRATTWADSRDGHGNRTDWPQLVIWCGAGADNWIKAEVHTAVDTDGKQWEVEYLPLNQKGRPEASISRFGNGKNFHHIAFDQAQAMVNRAKQVRGPETTMAAQLVAAAVEVVDAGRTGKRGKAGRREDKFERGGRHESKGRRNSRGGGEDYEN